MWRHPAIAVIFLWFSTAAGSAWAQLADPNALEGALGALEGRIEAARGKFLQDTDLPGFELDSPDLEADDPGLCAGKCAKDDQCRAWTYRKPRAGFPARCSLKYQVPPAVQSGCCVSGTREAMAGVDGEKVCDIDTERMSGSREYCASYWYVPQGAEKTKRHVYIVNSSWSESGWVKPAHWQDSVYNLCPVVLDIQKQRCEEMRNAP